MNNQPSLTHSKNLKRKSSRKTLKWIGKLYNQLTETYKHNTLISSVSNTSILSNQLELNKNIGQGAFGKVSKLKNIKNKNKNIIYKSITLKPAQGKSEYNSLEFHYKLQHKLQNSNELLKYLCTLYEYGFVQKSGTTLPNNNSKFTNIYAIMDNCGIELGEYILELKKSGNLTLNKIIYIMHECCKAVQILHDNRYCHLDIKPENFLVVKDEKNKLQIKIIDFGFVLNIGFGTNNGRIFVRGTDQYIDNLMYKKYYKVSISSDIFSLGCMFYEFIIILYSNYDQKIYLKLFVCPLPGNPDDRKQYNTENYEKDLNTIKDILLSLKINNNNKNDIIKIFGFMINPFLNERYTDIKYLISDLYKITTINNSIIKY